MKHDDDIMATGMTGCTLRACKPCWPYMLGTANNDGLLRMSCKTIQACNALHCQVTMAVCHRLKSCTTCLKIQEAKFGCVGAATDADSKMLSVDTPVQAIMLQRQHLHVQQDC